MARPVRLTLAEPAVSGPGFEGHTEEPLPPQPHEGRFTGMSSQPTRPDRLAKGLAGLLSDTYVLYNTTQSYHWNLEGPSFAALHDLFEQQYTEMAEAIDVLAERIRALGFYTPGTLEQFQAATRLEQRQDVRKTEVMLQHLIRGHQQIAHRIRELQPLAEKALDEATTDLLIERLHVHEKTTWMLRSQAGLSSRSLDVAGPTVMAAS
jgi:starvation-inducible DNA-binding protein